MTVLYTYTYTDTILYYANPVSSHINSPEPTSSFRTWQPHLCLPIGGLLWSTVNKLGQVEGQTPPFRWLLGICYSLVSSKGNTRARLTSVCESLEPSWVVGPIMITNNYIILYIYVRFLIVWIYLDCQMQPGTGWNHMGVPYELSVFSSTGRNQWHPQSRSLSPSDLLMQE